MPAIAPRAALITKDRNTIQRTLIPTSEAAVRLAEQARIALPTIVYLKKEI